MVSCLEWPATRERDKRTSSTRPGGLSHERGSALHTQRTATDGPEPARRGPRRARAPRPARPQPCQPSSRPQRDPQPRRRASRPHSARHRRAPTAVTTALPIQPRIICDETKRLHTTPFFPAGETKVFCVLSALIATSPLPSGGQLVPARGPCAIRATQSVSLLAEGVAQTGVPSGEFKTIPR